MFPMNEKFGHEWFKCFPHSITTGDQYIFLFDNGWGASVVPQIELNHRAIHSRQHIMKLEPVTGLWEIARITHENIPNKSIPESQLYDNKFFQIDCVVDYGIDHTRVRKLLKEIKEREPRNNFTEHPIDYIVGEPEGNRFANLL